MTVFVFVEATVFVKNVGKSWYMKVVVPFAKLAGIQNADSKKDLDCCQGVCFNTLR